MSDSTMAWMEKLITTAGEIREVLRDQTVYLSEGQAEQLLRDLRKMEKNPRVRVAWLLRARRGSGLARPLVTMDRSHPLVISDRPVCVGHTKP